MPTHALARHLIKKCPAFTALATSKKTANRPAQAQLPPGLHQSEQPKLYATDWATGYGRLNIPKNKYLQQTAGPDRPPQSTALTKTRPALRRRSARPGYLPESRSRNP